MSGNMQYVDSLMDAKELSQLSNSLKISINKNKKRIRDGGSLASVFGHVLPTPPLARTNTGDTNGSPNSDSSSTKSNGNPDQPAPVIWPHGRISNHIKELPGHYGQIHCVDWLGDSNHCITAAQDSNLVVWHALTGMKRCTIRLQSAFVMACAADKSGTSGMGTSLLARPERVCVHVMIVYMYTNPLLSPLSPLVQGGPSQWVASIT